MKRFTIDFKMFKVIRETIYEDIFVFGLHFAMIVIKEIAKYVRPDVWTASKVRMNRPCYEIHTVLKTYSRVCAEGIVVRTYHPRVTYACRKGVMRSSPESPHRLHIAAYHM